MLKFLNTNPSQADRKAMFELMRKFRGTRPGSPGRMLALAAMEKRAREQKYTPPPVKGIATPAPTPTTTTTPAPTPSPTPAPVQTPPPAPIPTATAAPVETPVATPTVVATPTS